MDEQHLDWDHRISLIESADLAHPIRNGFCAATAGPRNIELSPFGPGMLDFLPNRFPQSYFTHGNPIQFIARPLPVTCGVVGLCARCDTSIRLISCGIACTVATLMDGTATSLKVFTDRDLVLWQVSSHNATVTGQHLSLSR